MLIVVNQYRAKKRKKEKERLGKQGSRWSSRSSWVLSSVPGREGEKPSHPAEQMFGLVFAGFSVSFLKMVPNTAKSRSTGDMGRTARMIRKCQNRKENANTSCALLIKNVSLSIKLSITGTNIPKPEA